MTKETIMEALKKIWHWLRMEDENGKPIEEKMDYSRGIPISRSLRYSELIDDFPIHGKIGKEDILHLSHKLDDGLYETCYVTVKQLKDAILEMA